MFGSCRMQSFVMLCRMNFLCAVVREPTHIFVSVVNVFLFVFSPYSTVPDFIVSKQSVRITIFLLLFCGPLPHPSCFTRPDAFSDTIFLSTSCCYRWLLLTTFNSRYVWTLLEARGSAGGWGTALQVGRSRVRFPMMSLEFFIDIILPAALWLWGWLSL